MNESLTTMNRLLGEVAAHLKTGLPVDKRAAVEKLGRITSIASTLAFTIKLAR